MTDREQALREEIGRLNRIIKVLMDRVENNLSLHGTSDFSLFQSKIVLENQVKQRTAQLDAALRDNEKMNRALKESEAKFRAVLDQSMVGIVITEEGAFSYVNPKFADIFGYSEEEIMHLRPVDIAVRDERSFVKKQFRKGFADESQEIRFTFHGMRKDGRVVHVEVAGSPPTEIGGQRAIIAVITDITERSRVEEEMRVLQAQLREQAIHDPLTGLLNRRALEESLSRELIRALRRSEPLSVIICDLDHFKTINDTYGHLIGDEVLKGFGALLKKQTRGSDICCRYGGEEFVLVCPHMTDAKALERAEQLRRDCASMAFGFGATPLRVTASFGVATFPQHGRTGEALLNAADHALYAAKDAGRNQVKCYIGDNEAAGPSGETAWPASHSSI